MKARRLFRKDANGFNTMHDLYYEYTEHTVIRFNHMIVRKKLDKSLLICIYQFDNTNGTKYIDKLPLAEFTEQYINKRKLIFTRPLSKVTVLIQLLKDNELILLTCNNKINFQSEIHSLEKINYANIPDFDFELFYESVA